MRNQEELARWCAAGQGLNLGPRTVMVVAHPDDEAIGAGARLGHLQSIHLVHVTDGAPRNMRDARALGLSTRTAYARVRHDELLAALALAGLQPAQLRGLGIADQEAAHALPELTTSLLQILRAMLPEVILTHPYEGGHPDHDATAFAVHHACQLLRRGGQVAPVILEMTFYHLDGGTGRVGCFLPNGTEGTCVQLKAEEVIRKRRMLDCFVTQRTTLAGFPIGVERFRVAPAYDFTEPPHAGGLYYEMFPWGLMGEEWRRLARSGRRVLGVGKSAVG
jgi:LmbE family N-acetylglucosaminyl deacetylase